MDWTTFLQNLLFAIITAAVPVITTYFIIYLKKVSEKIDTETDELIISNTIKDALDLVMTVVESTSQTYVDALKKEGKFTLDAQKEAFESAKKTILALMSDEMKDILSALYKDIDKWVDNQIESTIKKKKKDGE